MEKRIFVAVLISIGFLWLWAAVAPKLFPDLMKKPVPEKPAVTATTATMASVPAAPATSTTSTATTATTASVEPPAAVPAVAPITASAQTITKVITDDFAAKFSNRGAELVSFQLTNYEAKPSSKTDESKVELVKDREPNRTDFPFAIEATDPKFTLAANSALYTVREFDEKGSHVIR